MHINVVCFTSHRLAHATNRITGLGKAKVIGLIDSPQSATSVRQTQRSQRHS